MNEAGDVITCCSCLIPKVIKAICNASVPEFVETAQSTLQYLANSSSNL